MNFHLTLNPEKSNGKTFRKNFQKDSDFGSFWAHFVDFWAKMNFLKELDSVTFKILQLSTIMQKNRKKLMNTYEE